MKTSVIFLFALLILTCSIGSQAQKTPPAKKTPQAGSKAYNAANSANQGAIPNQNNISKLPLKITKSTYNDTLSIAFAYGSAGEIKQITGKNAKGEKETFSFNYVNSKIIYTHISADTTETDTLYMSGNLITRDKYYSYVYENNKLVEIKPLMSFLSSYSIKYDADNNASEMTRIIPPMWKDDEEVTQVAIYDYDETLKNRFFFSTDWFFCPVNSEGDDVYRLPCSALFGLGSANLVKSVRNDSKTSKYEYKYLSLDESGYPTHYTINEISDYDYGSRILADYKITFIIK